MKFKVIKLIPFASNSMTLLHMTCITFILIRRVGVVEDAVPGTISVKKEGGIPF